MMAGTSTRAGSAPMARPPAAARLAKDVAFDGLARERAHRAPFRGGALLCRSVQLFRGAEADARRCPFVNEGRPTVRRRANDRL